jgi:biotin carboxyl carrier protein
MKAMLAEQEAKLVRMTKALDDRRKAKAAKAAAAAKSKAEAETRAAAEEAAEAARKANPVYSEMAARVMALQQRFTEVEKDIRAMAGVMHIRAHCFLGQVL